jgi:hypothetical protein
MQTIKIRSERRDRDYIECKENRVVVTKLPGEIKRESSGRQQKFRT